MRTTNGNEVHYYQVRLCEYGGCNAYAVIHTRQHVTRWIVRGTVYTVIGI